MQRGSQRCSASRLAFVILSALLPLLASGCLHTASVHRRTAASTDKREIAAGVPGVPFFIKRAVCKQQSVWVQPVYVIQLTTRTTYKASAPAVTPTPTAAPAPDKGSPDVTIRSTQKIMGQADFAKAQGDLSALRALLMDEHATGRPDFGGNVVKLWNQVLPNTTVVPQLREAEIVSTADAFLVSNSATAEVYVDYNTPFFYNTGRPWIGSSQLNVELAADGTLSKGSAQVESKTLQSVFDLIPVKEALTALTKVGFGVAPFEVQKAIESVQFELTIDTRRIKHTHSRYSGDVQPCAADPMFVVNNYSLQVEEVVPQAPSDDAEKSPSKKIKVNGSIELPKSE